MTLLNKVVVVSGTRPEVIKLAPIFKELTEQGFFVEWVCSGQHGDLQSQFLENFDINPHLVLDRINSKNLSELYSQLLSQIYNFLSATLPSAVVVHGDTATSFAAAFAAFLLKIDVFHVEAGLRSFDNFSPFPEEINRKFIDEISTMHFCPRQENLDNLKMQNISLKNAYVVGNSVVDALKIMSRAIDKNANLVSLYVRDLVQIFSNKKIIFFSMHRRENLGEFGYKILAGIEILLNKYHDLEIFYLKHPNPDTQFVVDFFNQKFAHRVRFLDFLSYPDAVFLLKNSAVVMSDSGGVLEEAVTLSKPVLSLRKKSERVHDDFDDQVFLLDKNASNLVPSFERLLNFNSSGTFSTAFGDGHASQKIVNLIKKFYEEKLSVS